MILLLMMRLIAKTLRKLRALSPWFWKAKKCHQSNAIFEERQAQVPNVS
jgi:hypothetical protein